MLIRDYRYCCSSFTQCTASLGHLMAWVFGPQKRNDVTWLVFWGRGALINGFVFKSILIAINFNKSLPSYFPCKKKTVSWQWSRKARALCCACVCFFVSRRAEGCLGLKKWLRNGAVDNERRRVQGAWSRNATERGWEDERRVRMEDERQVGRMKAEWEPNVSILIYMCTKWRLHSRDTDREKTPGSLALLVRRQMKFWF